ncbi:tetratricopeptide repeat protein [Streptomyces sp. NPDC050504]|uniref:tetratricopeptide repeat protein n=1 Tax=Streptomyces sp. NPDC050504 TaxID=3365618 RepID=UPI00379B15CA
MDRVPAPELGAALAGAPERPRLWRHLSGIVRSLGDPATAARWREWTEAGAEPGDTDRADALALALVEQARRHPALADELHAWLELATRPASFAPASSAPASPAPERPAVPSATHRVDNTVSGSRVSGPVIQAQEVHGGIHIHQAPAAPSAPAPQDTDPSGANGSPGSSAPRQIPRIPAHFTNRERELGELERLVPDVGRRPVMVVVNGPAGVGKTTLARRWLLGIADDFPGGQLYADLLGHAPGGPAAPGEVLGQFLRSLGITRVPVELGEAAALWRSVTAGSRIAVLLDDAVSAAQVRPLLPGTDHALVVVTSRGRLTGLGVDGASFQPVDPFSTRDTVELLRRRVGDERVSREPEAARQLAEACAGLPLAACVAAARVAARPRQPLAAMAGALGRDGERALDTLRVAGERAVRGALDESYRLLTAELARGYRRLGLSPVPLLNAPIAAAACAVEEDEGGRLLDELAEVNLLEDLGPDLRTGLDRYRFHDLVKVHAGLLAARSETPADSAAAVRRVVELYLHTATAAEALLTPSHRTLARDYEPPLTPEPPFTDPAGALRWLDAERAHLMAALRTAARSGWDHTAWQLADAMWPLFLRLRPYDLWIEAHEIGLAAARRAGSRPAVSRMLTSGGGGLRNAGRHDEAVEWFGQALEGAREDGDRKAEAQALHGIGQSHRLAGRLAPAALHFGQALELREAIGYRRGAALTRICLGDVALAEGRRADALPHLVRARADLLDVHDPYDAARALAFLGRAQLAPDGTGYDLAREQLGQALEEFEATGSVHWQGKVLELLGECAEERRDAEGARDWYTRSLARYAPVSDVDAERIRDRLRRLGPGPH